MTSSRREESMKSASDSKNTKSFSLNNRNRSRHCQNQQFLSSKQSPSLVVPNLNKGQAIGKKAILRPLFSRMEGCSNWGCTLPRGKRTKLGCKKSTDKCWICKINKSSSNSCRALDPRESKSSLIRYLQKYLAAIRRVLIRKYNKRYSLFIITEKTVPQVKAGKKIT